LTFIAGYWGCDRSQILCERIDIKMTKELCLHKLSLCNKVARGVWEIVWLLLYRPTPRLFHPWRCMLLRLFGAKLGKAVHPYPSSRVWAPWNLEMGDHACLSEGVDCYCVAKISIGAHSTISQYSFLCTASHDHSKAFMPLVAAPITIGERVWITADVFVGPGVTIGDGAVVTARSSVFSDLSPWMVARGNPAIAVKARKFDQP
jgi:putative colanic acid biosynthesis acetyltransferase WcaF